MGNTNAPVSQYTCEICMQCHPEKVNSSFIILQHTKFTRGNTAELILRCSEGHLCSYDSTPEDVDHHRKKIQQKSSMENIYISKIKALNETISSLQKEIENLKNKNDDLPPNPPEEPLKPCSYPPPRPIRCDKIELEGFE
jgi:hypothetical protein